jgi:hypothetical protein
MYIDIDSLKQIELAIKVEKLKSDQTSLTSYCWQGTASKQTYCRSKLSLLKSKHWLWTREKADLTVEKGVQ